MSKNKQPASLPGMEPATPSPHPTAIARDLWRCIVCNDPINADQKWTTMEGGRHRHSDCKMPSFIDQAVDIPQHQAFSTASATPTDHPPAPDHPTMMPGQGSTCVVCGYAIGNRQIPAVVDGCGFRHFDCKMPSEPPVTVPDGTPCAIQAVAGGEPCQPAPRKRKERTPRTPARACVYIERILSEYTPEQRRSICALLWESCGDEE